MGYVPDRRGRLKGLHLLSCGRVLPLLVSCFSKPKKTGFQVMRSITPNPQTNLLPLLRADGYKTLGCAPKLDLLLNQKAQDRGRHVSREPSPSPRVSFTGYVGSCPGRNSAGHSGGPGSHLGYFHRKPCQ